MDRAKHAVLEASQDVGHHCKSSGNPLKAFKQQSDIHFDKLPGCTSSVKEKNTRVDFLYRNQNIQHKVTKIRSCGIEKGIDK